MSNTPLIETRDLQKYFKVGGGALHAVDNVNIKVERGTTLGVVGESGCGKSTLGRCLLRLIEPTGGEVYYNGENILQYNKRQMREMRKKMQIIFQDPYSSINARMTVSDIIAENMIVNKIYDNKADIWKNTIRLMDTVGLARRLAYAYPHELDGGRRQRIGIARALAVNPEFIVCDEPVSALDVSIQAQILNLLMDLQDEFKLTYLFITHNMAVVKHISDSIAVMYLGQCIESAETDELFKNPRHPYTKALLSSIPVPDPDLSGKNIQTIKGELTSPINPAPGCRFMSRCDHACEACAQPQILRSVGGEHMCACGRVFAGEL